MRIRKKEMVVANVAKVLNSESESTQDTYSCDYINDEFQSTSGDISTVQDNVTTLQNKLDNCKVFTFNNEWRTAFKCNGMGLVCEIPIYNPNNSTPTLNITEATIFDGGSWVNLGSIQLGSYNTNQVILELSNSLSLTPGNYLVKLKGTVTVA